MNADDVLTDLLQPGLRAVFCGTQAGTQSARRGAYYAGRGNRFWPTLHDVGLTPVRLAPEQYPMLLDYGIGLTDMAKKTSGADSLLRPDHVDRTFHEDFNEVGNLCTDTVTGFAVWRDDRGNDDHAVA